METLNDTNTELRRLAEEKWHKHHEFVEKLYPQNPERLIHELEVHQIELELQNEELQMSLQELKESREKYFDLYDLAPVGYLTLTETGIICQANLTAAKLLGLERKQLENKLFYRFIFSADQDTYILNHNKLITSGEKEQFDLRMTRYDHTSFWARIISILSWNPDGTFENRLIISDISEMKRTEEQNNIFARAIRYTADCIAITDTDYKFIFVNDSFSRTYGYCKKELIGKSFDRIHSETNPSEITAQLFSDLSEKGSWKGELTHKRKDGSEFPASVSVAQIVDEKGKHVSTIEITRDISEHKRMETNLEKSNAELVQLNAEKDKFFTIIAHDLKSPFSGLLGISELLANTKSELSAEEINNLSATLNHSANNLYKLIINLLDWAMLQKGTLSFKPQELDLSKLVFENMDEIQLWTEQKGILIQSEISEGNAIYADEKMINSIIRNLLSNAVKFTSGDGKVTIRSKAVDKDMIEISVHDTGVGISKTNIGRLFRIDEKVSSPGTDGEPSTGLGLLLCREFVEKHGGKIWVESDPDGYRGGKGTTFSFSLPAPFREK